MANPRQANHIAFDEYARWIAYILDADHVEDSKGLYFRVAEAVAALTGAEYAVVVVPVDQDKLRVAGCGGLSTIIEDFPITRGVIGRVYRKALGGQKKYEIVDDVTKDNDYYSYHESVKSELAVPIFDSNRVRVESIINVESHNQARFDENHAKIISKIGDVMIQSHRQLWAVERLKNYSEALIQVLDRIPDELMIIDENYRPIYANAVKRERLNRLRVFLDKSTDDTLQRFLLSELWFKPDPLKTCHLIIEGHSKRCARCVCHRAMRQQDAIEGVIYKPEKMDDIVELSAAPLYSLDKKNVLGSVETARYLTKREKALGCSRDLFECVSEDQLLRAVMALLQNQLGYARVRVYSANTQSNRLEGVICAGPHKITSEEFSKFGFEIPKFLEKGLTESEKAGLLSTDEPLVSEESFGYWQIGVSAHEFIQSVDPEGLLELEGIKEFVIVPIIAREKRWIFCVDSKGKNMSFTSDDLQALTVFARFSSLALEMLEKNAWRFKLAILGETSLGFVHMFTHFFGSRGVHRKEMYDPLAKALGWGIEYMSSNQIGKDNKILSDFLLLVQETISGEAEVPYTGDIEDWVDKLRDELDNHKLKIPDSLLFSEMARVLPKNEKTIDFSKKFWATAQDNTALVKLVRAVTGLVIYLKNQERLTEEVDAFRDALAKLTPVGKEKKLDVAEACDMNLLVRTARDMVVRVVRGRIYMDLWHANVEVIAKKSELFLAFHALFKNALEAAKLAGRDAIVKVKTEVSDERGIVSIFNNGDYIAEENKEKVFHKAFTTKGQIGSSLGLVFVYDWITNSNKGEIVFSSDKESGTTFIVSFPIVSREHVGAFG